MGIKTNLASYQEQADKTRSILKGCYSEDQPKPTKEPRVLRYSRMHPGEIPFRDWMNRECARIGCGYHNLYRKFERGKLRPPESKRKVNAMVVFVLEEETIYTMNPELKSGQPLQDNQK